MSSGDSGETLEVISPEDHGGDLWVVTLLCVALATIAVATRFGAKTLFKFKIQVDDYVMVAAFVLVVIQCALVMESLVLGAGKDADLVHSDDIKPMMNCFVASQAFYVAALYGVKTSLILLITRLFQKPLKIYWASFVVLGIASVIAAAAGCTSFECSNNNPIARWVIVTILDIATEIVIIVVPYFPLQAIQMEPYDKFKVMLSFSTRLFAIAFSILSVWAISFAVTDPTKATNGSAGPLTGPTTAVVIPSIFQQFELMLSICVAAILPCFRLIFQVCEEDDGTMVTQRGPDNDQHNTQDSKHSQVASFGMERRNGSRSGKASSSSSRDTADTFGPGSTTEARHGVLNAHPLPRLSSSSLLGSDKSRKEKADSVV